MKRKELLETKVAEIWGNEQASLFIDYTLKDEDLLFVKQVVEEVFWTVPPVAFNCTLLSVLLYQTIKVNSKIPVVLITGHLDYMGTRLFDGTTPLPKGKGNESIHMLWEGHCWVEFGQKVLDLSIFRTMYYGQVPPEVRNMIVHRFGEGRGALWGTPEYLLKKEGFDYTPCFCLEHIQIEGLLNGAETLLNL